MPKKVKLPKTPKLYEGLDLQDNTARHRTLVIDKNNQVFKFAQPQHVHIVKDAILHMWPGWVEFDNELEKNAALTLELHKRAFGQNPPTENTRIDTTVATWAKFISMAEDRIKGSSGNPVTGANGARKSLESRVYIAVRNPDKSFPSTDAIKTPQAVACIKILRDNAKEVDGTLSMTEKDLREAIVKNAEAIRTRQDPWRIFQYYRAKLVEHGVLKHD